LGIRERYLKELSAKRVRNGNRHSRFTDPNPVLLAEPGFRLFGQYRAHDHGDVRRLRAKVVLELAKPAI
jgi:hypothetical protein